MHAVGGGRGGRVRIYLCVCVCVCVCVETEPMVDKGNWEEMPDPRCA